MINNKEYKLQAKKIDFPVSFSIKVVMFTTTPDAVNRRTLKDIFEKLSIKHNNWQSKKSGENKYIRYAVDIKLDNHPQMTALYAALNEEEKVKFAL